MGLMSRQDAELDVILHAVIKVDYRVLGNSEGKRATLVDERE